MNRDAVRAVLHADRCWSIYALGDLAPARLPHARWFVNSAATALVLLYAEFEEPILFAAGPPVDLDPLLDTIPLPASVLLHIRPDAAPLIERRYRRLRTKRMLRMSSQTAPEEDTTGVELLSVENADEVRALYSDGAASGESPDFFYPQMLADGTFHGIRREGRLVSAAGTHLVFDEESIGAIGNVYTHRQWRNRGLGRLVTAAVVRRLAAARIRTRALNVYVGNVKARRVYESLGFIVHCDFLEGRAHGLR